jgi:hypothetical protein
MQDLQSARGSGLGRCQNPWVSVDRILDVIDAGLQSSTEMGYGSDRWPDRCVRCQEATPAESGDLCAGCRAFLLGDSDVDPRDPWSLPRGQMEVELEADEEQWPQQWLQVFSQAENTQDTQTVRVAGWRADCPVCGQAVTAINQELAGDDPLWSVDVRSCIPDPRTWLWTVEPCGHEVTGVEWHTGPAPDGPIVRYSPPPGTLTGQRYWPLEEDGCE